MYFGECSEFVGDEEVGVEFPCKLDAAGFSVVDPGGLELLVLDFVDCELVLMLENDVGCPGVWVVVLAGVFEFFEDDFGGMNIEFGEK